MVQVRTSSLSRPQNNGSSALMLAVRVCGVWAEEEAGGLVMVIGVVVRVSLKALEISVAETILACVEAT
jgi:hypothetical protein